MNRKKIVMIVSSIAITIFTFVVSSATFLHTSVFAASDGNLDSVRQKSLLYGIYLQCYVGGKMETPMTYEQYETPAYLVADGNPAVITLPMGLYSSGAGFLTQTNCREALIGNSTTKFPGIFEQTGAAAVTSSAGPAAVNKFFEDIGYTAYNAKEGKCANYIYINGSGDRTINTMCASVDNEGRITSDKMTIVGAEKNKNLQLEVGTGFIQPDCHQDAALILHDDYGGCKKVTFEKGKTTFTEFAGKVWGEVSEHHAKSGKYNLQPLEVTDRKDTDVSYKIGSKVTAGTKAVKYLSNGKYSKVRDLKLTKKERALLLENYLKNFYKVESYGCNLDNETIEVAKGAGYSEVKTTLYSNSGGWQTCWIKPTAQKSVKVAGFEKVEGSYIKKNFFDVQNKKPMDFTEVVKALNQIIGSGGVFSKDDATISPGSGILAENTGNNDDSNDAINCYESAGALGYIVCPTIQKAGDAAQSIYETAIVDQLEFDSDKIISGNDSLRNSWSFFRDIANIIFVILLAAVLFSQFTGFGISNYGIKKILPRLIIMVILVNISFIICQLAVDVSNLLGHAFYNTFKDFSGASDNLGGMIDNMLNGQGGLFNTVSSNTLPEAHPSGIATGLTIGGVAIALATWDTWIIPVLIAVIGFIVSVIFFAILLSVRQAGIIVLIALTPVAVVCYSLPNTKTIFDKWFKLFSSLLMVFPIAGLLMGGGIWASNLMLDTGGGRSDAGLGGFFFALTAMLLQVIPFFFVPTLVKNSLSAAGQLGAKIAGMGDRLGSSLQKTARNSNRAKDTQERMSGWRANRRVNPWYNGDGKIANSALGRGRRAIAGVGDKVRGGNNRVSRMLNNSHNRRMNRLAAAALATDLNSRDRTSAYAEKHVQEIAKDFSGRWKNEGRLDPDSVGAELESAIADLSKDSTDVNAKGRYLAAMMELNKTGPGRDKVGQSLLNAVGENGPRANRGIQWAYNTLLDESGDLYKRKSGYTLANAQQFSKAGDFNMSGMVKVDEDGNIVDRDEEGNWVNTNNIGKNLDDMSAQRIADLDKSELDRIVEMSQKPVGENTGGFRTAEERNRFISAAMSANTNPNVTVDSDKAERIDKIANASYIAANAGNDSASTVSLANIKSMANSSQAALDSQLTSIQNGTIKDDDLTRLANVAEATLNDANAGRSNITQETADKLNRIRAADGRTAITYTRAEINIPHGGNNSDIQIVGDTGNISGYAERARQENRNRNGSNNGNDGGSGGIIMPR